jgi:hypothetical protein
MCQNHIPHRRREKHQADYEGPSREQISQRTQEQQSSSIAGLHYRWDLRNFLILDTEVVGLEEGSQWKVITSTTIEIVQSISEIQSMVAVYVS